MNLNSISSYQKESLSYVMLDQENGNDRPNTDSFFCIDNEETEEKKDDVQSNESDASIGNIQPESQLLSNSCATDLSRKLLSALAYGICSFLITVINKIVLTSYEFPSSTLLGVGQMIAILIILKVASLFHVVTIRKKSLRNGKIWTLSVLYLCNLITGLAGTKHLPLPMFIALRRFSIAMTAIAMIGGSLIAAAADLTFNALGYLTVMSGNFFTAANGVYVKKAINSQEINKHEILYYNALLTLVPALIISFCTTSKTELLNYSHWSEIGFIVSFLTSCFMGYLLLFSTLLCTHYNSALTTTIIGTLKNILTTYVGMYIGGDYRYSHLNFLGLNISLIGSLIYTYLTFHRPSVKETLNQIQIK